MTPDANLPAEMSCLKNFSADADRLKVSMDSLDTAHSASDCFIAFHVGIRHASAEDGSHRHC
jgi:hypothetical protein